MHRNNHIQDLKYDFLNIEYDVQIHPFLENKILTQFQKDFFKKKRKIASGHIVAFPRAGASLN